MAEERVSNPVADNGSVEVVPPDEQRCHKSNGKGWRCKRVRSSAHNPSNYCDYHYNSTWYKKRLGKQGRKKHRDHPSSKSQKKPRRMQQHDFERDLNFGLVSAPIPIAIDASPLNSSEAPFGAEESKGNDDSNTGFIGSVFREERCSGSSDRIVPEFEWNGESSTSGCSDNVTSPGILTSSNHGLRATAAGVVRVDEDLQVFTTGVVQASATLVVDTAGVVRPAVANESQTCVIGTVGVEQRQEGDVNEDVGANAIPLNSLQSPFGREATRGNDFSYTVLSDDSSPDENYVSTASDNVTPPGRTEPTCDNRNMVIQSDSSSDSLSNHEAFSDYRLVGAGSNMLRQGSVNARLFQPPSVSQTNATAEHNSAPRSPAQPSNEPDFGLLLQATMGHCNQFMSSVAQLNDAHYQHSLTITQLSATIRLMTGKLSRVQQELADSRSRETQLQSSLDDSRSREMQLESSLADFRSREMQLQSSLDDMTRLLSKA